MKGVNVMKKWILTLCVAMGVGNLALAQDYDDLYYTPKKKKQEAVEEQKAVRPASPAVQVTTPKEDAPMVREQRNAERDVDEYNRRYSASDYDFEVEGDTLTVREKAYPADEGGEWVRDFDGSEDDYEYAMRLVRFRNPRFAVPVSSPLYWDIVYGLDSWDWNVYTDGFYAYAFPTYTNRLWWDWRFGSFGVTWGFPYYSAYWGYYGCHPYPYYGWGGWCGHHGWCDPWYGGHAARPVYYNGRPAVGSHGGYSSRATAVRPATGRASASSRTDGYVRGETVRAGAGRVVGTRTQVPRTGDSQTVRTGARSTLQDRTNGNYVRSGSTMRTGTTDRSSSYNRAGSSRSEGTTARPSSTRRSSGAYTPAESSTRSGSYSRGSSSSRGSYSSGSYSSGSSSVSRAGSGGGSSRGSSRR